eukprot:341004-Rhodomonas_salina.1
MSAPATATTTTSNPAYASIIAQTLVPYSPCQYQTLVPAPYQTLRSTLSYLSTRHRIPNA